MALQHTILKLSACQSKQLIFTINILIKNTERIRGKMEARAPQVIVEDLDHFHADPDNLHADPDQFHADPDNFNADPDYFHVDQDHFHADQGHFHADLDHFQETASPTPLAVESS